MVVLLVMYCVGRCSVDVFLPFYTLRRQVLRRLLPADCARKLVLSVLRLPIVMIVGGVRKTIPVLSGQTYDTIYEIVR